MVAKKMVDKNLTSDLPHSSITGLSPGSAAVSMVRPRAPGDPLKTNKAVPAFFKTQKNNRYQKII